MNPIVSEHGKVVFDPWPGPQQTFWDFRGRWGLYGGSGNTGKSDLLRWYPWQQVQAEDKRIAAGEHTENSRGHALLLRRETPELREIMARCRRDFEIYGAKWHAGDKTWSFGNGYNFTVGHLENPDDWKKYQGWEISCLCLDEMTTFLESQIRWLNSWVRQPKGSHLTPIIRGGTNPVGVGLLWVRKMFVEGAKPGHVVTRDVEVPVLDGDGKLRKEMRRYEYLFVQAHVSDNKSVDQGDYAATFADQPDAIRKAVFEGDWYVISDSLLGLLWESPIHIVKPYKVAANRNKFRSIHFSYASTVVLWFAVDTNGNMSAYRELYLRNHTAEMVANRIRELEEEGEGEWLEGDKFSRLTGPLGPKSAWPQKGQVGESAMETMFKVGVGTSPADESPPIDQIRSRLIRRGKHPTDKVDGKPALTMPGVRFFKTCRQSIETIPSLPHDKDDPDVPDKRADAVAYKALAYAVMSRPLSPDKQTQHDEDWETWEKPRPARASKTGLPGMW